MTASEPSRMGCGACGVAHTEELCVGSAPHHERMRKLALAGVAGTLEPHCKPQRILLQSQENMLTHSQAHGGTASSAQHLADRPERLRWMRNLGQPLLGFCRRPTYRQSEGKLIESLRHGRAVTMNPPEHERVRP